MFQKLARSFAVGFRLLGASVCLSGSLLAEPAAAAQPPKFELPADAHLNGSWRVAEGNLPLAFMRQTPPPAEPWMADYIGTAEAGDGLWQDGRMGVITGPSFLVTERYYEVAVSGGWDFERTHILFCLEDSGREVWRVLGRRQGEFGKSFVPLGSAMGKRVVIKLVDREANGWGHIRFGGLRIANQELARRDLVQMQLGQLRNQQFRQHVAHWLRANATAADVDLMNRTLQDRDQTVVWEVIWLLRALGCSNRETVSILTQHLKKGHERTTSYSLLLLAEIRGHRLPIDEIDRLMREAPVPRTRKDAIGALARIGSIDTMRRIRERLPIESDGGVKAHAQRALDSQGYTRTEFPAITPGVPSRGWLNGMEYFVYLPPQWTPKQQWPVIAVVHGTWGNGLDYMETIKPDARVKGFVIIAPTFDQSHNWDFGAFALETAGRRADLQFWEMIDQAGPRFSLKTSKISIFGQSEGGRFASKIITTYPNRIWKAACASNEFGVFPDEQLPFPRGLAVNPFAPDLKPRMDGVLDGRLQLFLGDLDHKNGVADGNNWTAAVDAYAKSKGVPNHYKFTVIPGAVHSGKQVYHYARPWLLSSLP